MTIPTATAADVPDTTAAAGAADPRAAIDAPVDGALAMLSLARQAARIVDGISIRFGGRVGYAQSFDAMRAFTDARTPSTPDEIWLVEHPPVYTLGQAGDPSHLLSGARGIDLVRTDRGGQITYHGPGQVVAYLLVDLRRHGLMVKAFVRQIEEAVIETLAAYNLQGERHAGAPGIYLAEGPLAGAKIAALGLKIRNGCSYHGVSLNVKMDLRPFDDINPCGYAGLQTVDMAQAGVSAAWLDVADTLASRLVAQIPIVARPPAL